MVMTYHSMPISIPVSWQYNQSVFNFLLIAWYHNIYIVIIRRTVSMYHYTSVWQDPPATSSQERKPADFMPVGYLTILSQNHWSFQPERREFLRITYVIGYWSVQFMWRAMHLCVRGSQQILHTCSQSQGGSISIYLSIYPRSIW